MSSAKWQSFCLCSMGKEQPVASALISSGLKLIYITAHKLGRLLGH